LPRTSAAFEVKPLLDELRSEVGDSEFGYRIQALFAHVLLRLGGVVSTVNAQGHPDIGARLGDRELLIQVKAVSHASASQIVNVADEDLRGIAPTGRREGVLAFLDCAEPVEWIVIPFARANALSGRSVHVATVRAERDVALSEDCTGEFLDMVLTIGKRLRTMTYRVLRRRALRGEAV